MLRGEPLDGLSRELGVEIYRLEQWRDKALSGMEASLQRREGDLLQIELGPGDEEDRRAVHGK